MISFAEKAHRHYESAKRKVAVASDHGGFPLKEAIKKHLERHHVQVLDVGTGSTEACDYPVFACRAAELVASGKATRAIVVDGAGIGSCMTANKVPGVRAAMAFNEATAKNAREHNDANVLSLGASYLDESLALKLVDIFLSTDCTADRHKRRVDLINALDGSRSSFSMASTVPNDFESLATQIAQVLSANPGLLGALGSNRRELPMLGSCGGCTVEGHCATKCKEAVQSVLAPAPKGRLSSALGVGQTERDIAKYIDHTLLKPDATYAEIDKLCEEAVTHGFASVCVNPMHVKRCAAKLKGSSSVVCTVVGFPLGATPSEVKALEARRAIREGAKEIDMVIAIGALKSCDDKYVYDDIRIVAESVRDGGAILKVIIETALLTDEEKVRACVLAKRARANFVKTSTGFAKGGATVHDVALMAEAVEHKLHVKASGGVRSADDAKKMIAAGATRIGASVGVAIAQEAKGHSPSPAQSKGSY